jgi:hypothetical protein
MITEIQIVSMLLSACCCALCLLQVVSMKEKYGLKKQYCTSKGIFEDLRTSHLQLRKFLTVIGSGETSSFPLLRRNRKRRNKFLSSLEKRMKRA